MTQIEEQDGLEVWDAIRDDGTQREPHRVVIRMVSDPDDAEAAETLREQYEAIRDLEDPRLPRVVGYFAGHGALARERAEGFRLSLICSLYAAGLVTVEAATAVDIALEVAYALRAGHALLREGARTLHGALAPTLVFLEPDGSVRLLGTAGRHRQPSRYLPPEYLYGRGPSIAGDQWQLGALLYELVAGEPLYPHDHPLDRDTAGALRRLDASQPAISRFLRRALAEDPQDRFRTDRELLHALHALLRELDGPSRRSELYAETREAQNRLGDPAEAPDPPLSMQLPEGEDRRVSAKVAGLLRNSGPSVLLGERAEEELPGPLPPLVEPPARSLAPLPPTTTEAEEDLELDPGDPELGLETERTEPVAAVVVAEATEDPEEEDSSALTEPRPAVEEIVPEPDRRLEPMEIAAWALFVSFCVCALVFIAWKIL